MYDCSLPVRKRLPHDVPFFINPTAEIYFITINCKVRGSNQLWLSGVGEALLESVRFRQGCDQWFVHLFLLMPDHVHALLTFPQESRGLQSTVSNWKRWTAKNCGVSWQRDFFEHRLRGEKALSEKTAYIRANPLRAGLAQDPAEWPWWWSSN